MRWLVNWLESFTLTMFVESTVIKGLVGEQLPTSGSSGRPQVLGPSSWMTT